MTAGEDKSMCLLSSHTFHILSEHTVVLTECEHYMHILVYEDNGEWL